MALNEEQEAFLEECENEFSDRYTDKEKPFMDIKILESKKPPIVDPWYNKQRRPPYEWSRQNQGKRGHHQDRRNSERHDRADHNVDRHFKSHYKSCSY